MPKISAMFIVPAIIGAALCGYLVAGRSSAAASTAAPVVASSAPSPSALPPNHPSVASAQRIPHAMPNGDNQRPPSLDWKVPESWEVEANTNPMRLATYRVANGSEVSVARAGGPVDANIIRWSQQFDNSPPGVRTDKQVRGLHVAIVRIEGTYSALGTSTAEPENHAGWTMLAAIVEVPGAPYFFKIIGPAAQVDGARASFDALIDSVSAHREPAR